MGTLNGKAGIWIDHRKALVVLMNPTETHSVLIESKVEKHPERAGDSPLKGRFEAAQVPPEDRRQRALGDELHMYYDAVIAALRGAGELIIFGPGLAKGELQKRLVKLKLGARVAAVQTVDKMSNRQIVARVRDYFNEPRPPTELKRGRPSARVRGGRARRR
jgi:hypothetical protein